jgi:hypothetical protein
MTTDVDQEALRRQARRHVERVRTLKMHVAVYAVGVAFITGIWAVTQYQASHGWPDRFAAGNDRTGTWSIWVVWPVLVWTQIVLVHALVSYLRRPVSEAAIERELERLERDR